MARACSVTTNKGQSHALVCALVGVKERRMKVCWGIVRLSSFIDGHIGCAAFTRDWTKGKQTLGRCAPVRRRLFKRPRAALASLRYSPSRLIPSAGVMKMDTPP